MSQADEERFFAVLEGRAEGDAEASGARVLRQAVEARAETLQEIAAMDDTPAASAEQNAGISARRQVLFAKPRRCVPSPIYPPLRPPGRAQRHSERTTQVRRRRLGAAPPCSAAGGGAHFFAALLALVVGIIVQQAGYDQPTRESELVRGARDNVVVTDQAARLVVDLTTRPEASGAAVVVAQISAREWNLNVEVAATADRALIQKLLRDAGFGDIVVGSTNQLVIRAAASSPAAE